MNGARHLGAALALALAAAPVAPTAGAAQALRGTVTEEGRGTPVAGVVVTLRDRDGAVKAGTTTDAAGAFLLAPPEAGEYRVEAARLGYETTRSLLFAMTTEGTVPFEIVLRPTPIGLEGFEVTVEREAEAFLQPLGLTPTRLGRRWIGRPEIEALPVSTPGPLEMIRWRSIPGIWVAEPPAGAPPTLCVTSVRRGQCALILLNGVQISGVDAQAIPPEDIEAIAVLSAIDAATFYGTEGGAGAVLIWTRR